MKNIFHNFIACVTLSCCIVTTNAQFYLKAFTGYSFCSHPIPYANFQETINNTVSTTSFKYKPGNGLNVGFAGGYNINSKIGVEINANFILPHTKEGKYQYSTNFFGRTDAYNLKSSTSVYNFSSMLVFSVPYKSKTNIYFKAGPNFLLLKTKLNNKTTEYYTNSNSTSIKDEENILKGKINIGFQGAIGACFKQSKKISFFSEFNVINSNYLYKNYTYSNGSNNETGEISERIVYNSLALNVGVKYNLTGTK